ncbi:MAG: hypothetical protein ACOYZ8_11030 [Chloroflexota bacterium]
MENEKLTEYIIERLARSANRDDLILEVCRATGANWDEAEGKVSEVEVYRADEIARRQSPVLAALAAVIFLSGARLALNALTGLQTLTRDILLAGPEQVRGVALVVMLAELAPGAFWQAVTGSAMMAGSLIGLYDVWPVIRNQIKLMFD